MAERPPINPFANLRPDPTSAKLATDSANNLARTRQALGIQRMVDASKIANTNANNKATMARLGITENIGDLARGLGVTPTVINRLGKRARIDDVSKTAPAMVSLARLRKGIEPRPGDTAVDATNVDRQLSKVESPTVADAKAGLKSTGSTELKTTGFGAGPSGKFEKQERTVGTKVESKGNTKANQVLYKKITDNVMDKLGLKDPVVISHVKDQGAIVEHTVNGKRVRSPVTYNNSKP